VVAGTLPNAFANLEAKDCCCTESALIYKQKNAMLGLQVAYIVVPPYSMLPAAATASREHVAAAVSSCRPVLLKPCSEMKLDSVQHLLKK